MEGHEQVELFPGIIYWSVGPHNSTTLTTYLADQYCTWACGDLGEKWNQTAIW